MSVYNMMSVLADLVRILFYDRSYGGFFVLVDSLKEDEPQAEVWKAPTEDADSDTARWEVYRFDLTQCFFTNGVLSDNDSHKDLPANFASTIGAIASYTGLETSELITLLCSEDPVSRGLGYHAIFSYDSGYLDSEPCNLTLTEIIARHAARPALT